MVMNSLKMYGMAFVVLSSFSLACGMEEVKIETIDLLPRPATISREVLVSPRVSRKKQQSNATPEQQSVSMSNSASPNLLRKVLKDRHEEELQNLVPLVSPVRSKKSDKSSAVKMKQFGLLKSVKKA